MLSPGIIEAAAVKAHPSVRPGGVAAVAVRQGGTESLLLVFEVDGAVGKEEYDLLCRQISEAVVLST